MSRRQYWLCCVAFIVVAAAIGVMLGYVMPLWAAVPASVLVGCVIGDAGSRTLIKRLLPPDDGS